MADGDLLHILIAAVESDVVHPEFEVSDFTVHAIHGLVCQMMNLRNFHEWEKLEAVLESLSNGALRMVCSELMYLLSYEQSPND